MRIAFMGTPDFAVPTLRALVAAGHDMVAVYTQPPRPANRGKKLSPSAVQLVAEELNLPVFSPTTLRDSLAQAAFAGHELDVAVVAAYGLILPQVILDAPKMGCLNIHGSLLPRWRGAAPVQRAILAGDTETGVEIMQMAAGLDVGEVYTGRRINIGYKTAGELTAELAEIGAKLMVEILADIGNFRAISQSEVGATYATKIDKAETRILFNDLSVNIERQIRAFNPLPGAWFEYAGERYRILAADIVPASGSAGLVLDNMLTIACADGAIRPTIIQRAGKPAMTVEELQRGKPIPAGTQL
jgi:methionyl-tRNA formyltransferase